MSGFFNMPLVSFVVTSYNCAQYVVECVESVLAQSYQNIEIIIVDDHSRDNSVEIINNIIKNNKSNIKIKLISHKRSKGQLATVFDGILASNGEFVACVNAVDKVAKDFAMIHTGIHLFYPVAFSVCELYEINEKSTLNSLVSSNLSEDLGGKLVDGLKVKIKELQFRSVVKILDKKSNFFGGWWWAPLSCAMIRRSSILPFLKFDRFNNWRTSADNLLFNFLHLVGGSIKIYEPLVGYRSCADNAGSRNVLGNIRYNTNDAKKSYWDNKINLFKGI